MLPLIVKKWSVASYAGHFLTNQITRKPVPISCYIMMHAVKGEGFFCPDIRVDAHAKQGKTMTSWNKNPLPFTNPFSL